MKAIFESILFSWQQCHTGAKVKNDCAPKYCISGKSNVSGGNVEMGARGRYIGRRAILSQLPHQRERERGGGLFMPHSDTQPSFNQTYKTKQTKPNQTKPTKLTKPNNHNATRERGGSQQLKFEQPNQTKPITYHRMTTMS